MQSLEKIRQIKAVHEKSLLNIPGVTGIDIGYKVVNGQKTDELAIRVYVEEKKTKANLPVEQIIPNEIEGVKTDVIQRRFAPFASQTESNDPHR